MVILLSQQGAPETHKTIPVRSPGKLISRRLVGRITKTYSAKVPEETSHAGVNYVEHSVVEQAIDQWRERLDSCVEAKGNHFEHFVVGLNNTMTTSRPWQVLGRLKGEMIHPER